jgi:hypothetical protein
MFEFPLHMQIYDIQIYGDPTYKFRILIVDGKN